MHLLKKAEKYVGLEPEHDSRIGIFWGWTLSNTSTEYLRVTQLRFHGLWSWNTSLLIGAVRNTRLDVLNYYAFVSQPLVRIRIAYRYPVIAWRRHCPISLFAPRCG